MQAEISVLRQVDAIFSGGVENVGDFGAADEDSDATPEATPSSSPIPLPGFVYIQGRAAYMSIKEQHYGTVTLIHLA